MFRHVLIPTDGSELSEKAILEGVQFAKSIHAKVTGFSAVPEFHVLTYNTEMLEDTPEEFAQHSQEHAKQWLAVIDRAAKNAGVECDTLYTVSDNPDESIIQVAAEKGCDVIVMASHGRTGLQAALLGSHTQKVLAHSKIPVLLYR